jgi:hypothetical protein
MGHVGGYSGIVEKGLRKRFRNEKRIPREEYASIEDYISEFPVSSSTNLLDSFSFHL